MSTSEGQGNEVLDKEVVQVLDYLDYLKKNPPVDIDGFSIYSGKEDYMGNQYLSQLFSHDMEYDVLAINMELKRFYVDVDKLYKVISQRKDIHPMSQYGFNNNIGLMIKLDDKWYTERRLDDQGNYRYYKVVVNQFINIRFYTFLSIALTFVLTVDDITDEEEQNEANTEFDEELDVDP